MPGTTELLAVNWPHGLIGVHIDTGVVRPVTSFNAWHAMVNREGSLMVADTTCPDIGLQLFDPRPGLRSLHRALTARLVPLGDTRVGKNTHIRTSGGQA